MKTFLKYLLTLLVGISLGVGGEMFMPKNLAVNLTSGCVRSTTTGNIFILAMFLQMSNQEKPFPLWDPDLNWNDYVNAYGFLSGNLERLSNDECVALFQKMNLQGDDQ